jgi:endonuclease/exonuclease/phosphatase family metal-dependent hydrolase
VLATLTVLSLEQIRASGPLLSRSFDTGTTNAALTAFVTYALPGLLATAFVLLGRRLPGSDVGAQTVRDTRPGRDAFSYRPAVTGFSLLFAVVALAAARVAMQATNGDARFWVGLVAVGIAIAALTLGVALVAGRDQGPVETIVGLSLGTAVALVCQWMLSGWDPLWRGGPLGWAHTLVLVVVAVALAWVTRRSHPQVQVRGLGWLGPWLALSAMILANAPFLASQASTTLAIAAGSLVLAAGATAALLARGILAPVPGPVLALALPVAVAGIFWLSGPVVLVAAVLAVPAAAAALVRALRPALDGAPSVGRTAGVASIVGLSTIVPLLVYQLDYDVPLHVPNALVLVVLAALAAAPGWRRALPSAETGPELEQSQPVVATVRAPADGVTRRLAEALALAGIAALGIGIALPASVPYPSAAALVPYPSAVALVPDRTDRTDRTTIRLVSWNLHYGVASGPGVDLDQVARTIEAEHPDLVTLQEVERGWILGGGADMATYLSNRLGMPFVYAPAADRQFGNVILSTRPLTEVAIHALPYGDGPQQRSAISATVDTGAVRLRITSVHLQHRAENTPTRQKQIAELVRAEPLSGSAVVAGDFNAEPGWPEIGAMTAAGYQSAQDTVGDPTGLTSPAEAPMERIDWIFGSGVSWTDFTILGDAHSSDHRGLAVTITAPGVVPG